MPKELRILLGPPGCGKSTYAKKKAEETGAKIVNLDEIRLMLGHRYNPRQEIYVYQIGTQLVQGFMVDEQDVILDEAYTTLEVLLPYIQLAEHYSYRKVGVVFNTSLNTCLERRDDGSFPLQCINEKSAELDWHLPYITRAMDEIEEAA